MRVHLKSAVTAAFLLLFVAGCRHAPPVTLSAAANPPAVYPGDLITVTATAGSVDTNKKNNVVYNWSGTGVSGNGTSATVATATLAPGTYTAKADVKEGKKGKEGRKPGQTADATASFTVKAFEPPTIGCTASPSSIRPGESSSVTAAGVSPQNRPLTYSYSTTGGRVSGSGNTATFSSAGAPTGMVGITCTATDDQGQTATTNTSVTILAPHIASMPSVQQLGRIDYINGKQHPTLVNNEAAAILDAVVLAMQRQPDAMLVVVGYASLAEKMPENGNHANGIKDIAAQRAVNVKDYLVTEKGIGAARIGVARGTEDAQKVETYLMPAGANFAADVPGTSPVNENAVKPQPFESIEKGTGLDQGGGSGFVQMQAGGATTPENPVNCKVFVILAYPSYVDLTIPGPIPDSFHLYVGKNTPPDGIPAQLRSTLCQVAKSPEDCIQFQKWKDACNAGVSIEIGPLDKKRRSMVAVWPLKTEIQGPVLGDLLLPPGITPVFDGKTGEPKSIELAFAEFIWKANVDLEPMEKKGAFNQPHVMVYDKVRNTVFDSNPGAFLVFTLDPGGGGEPVLVWANRKIKEPIVQYFLGGSILSTIALIAGIMGWFRRKKGSNAKP
jgi:outer membrane protein OmpA-like peptidoglycan-associated protein